MQLFRKHIPELSKIRFYKLEKLGDISSAFYAPSLYLNECSVKDICLKLFKPIYNKERYTSKKIRNGSIFIVFSHNYRDRMDYWRTFKNISKLINNKTMIYPGKDRKKGNFINLPLIGIWFWQLRRVELSSNLKLQYCIELYKSYLNLLQAKKFLKEKKVKLLFSFVDIHSADSLITLYANSKGIETASIQHAAINMDLQYLYANYDTSNIILQSKSKFLLIYGKQTRVFANKIGARNKRLLEVGCSYTLNADLKKVNKTKKNVFLIMLNGIPDGKKSVTNLELIKIGELIAKCYNYEFIIRKHPSDNFNYAINKKYMLRFSEKKESLGKLTNHIDFVIMGNSTAFIELCYLNIPTFLYKGSKMDLYSEIEWNKFKNFEEIKRILDIYFNNISLINKKMDRTRRWLLAPGKTEDNFRLFFNDFDM